ncbi:MAG: hypothetical protein NZL92_01345 [Gloeomargarita sp. SKYG116]|nr:hypothetical protein [Gloeomargarita sp. SKYG116]MCS7225762.1 hypothetical protein [Gloeomargarita sp. SKYB31]MDW8400324.1 hypothetical protein [Gloeomargarita sp. SKYGB_i_bin116]
MPASPNFEEQVLSELRNISVRLDSLETRVGGLEAKVERLESRVERLETKVDNLETKVESLEKKVDGLGAKVNGLEADLQQTQKWQDRTWDVIKWVGGISAGLSISAAIALVGLVFRLSTAL